MNFIAQLGQEVALEPQILFEPMIVVPRRMRDWKVAWLIVAPSRNRFGQGSFSNTRQMIGLCILASDHEHLKVRHGREEPRVPGFLANRRRREVSIGALAWIAKRLRHDCHLGIVVEVCLGQVQPLPETLSAGVVPWNATRLNLGSRRLSGDQYLGTDRSPQHRTRPEREVRRAQAARPHLDQQAA